MTTEGALRLFRAAIFNGVRPPAAVVSFLETRGVNIGELEARLVRAFSRP
jgi:hypothetical protein